MDSDGLHEEKMTRATFWTEFLALADMGLIMAGPERGGLVTAEVTPRGRLVLQEEIRQALTPDPSPSGRGEKEAGEEKEGDDAALES